jgi:hypothetical protein
LANYANLNVAKWTREAMLSIENVARNIEVYVHGNSKWAASIVVRPGK